MKVIHKTILAPTGSIQTHYHYVNRAMPLFSFRFRYRCNDFEQVNSDRLMLHVFSCKGESILNERHVLNL